MINQIRTVTAQDIRNLVDENPENFCEVIAALMNRKQHALIGRYIQTVIAEMDRDQSEFVLPVGATLQVKTAGQATPI